MKKTIATMFVLCSVMVMTACIEDGVTSQDVTGGDAGQPAPTVTGTANPPTVTAGGSTVITWVYTNATSCWSLGADGTTHVPLESDIWSVTNIQEGFTYTLHCDGPGGSAEGSVTVTVNPAPTGCTCDDDCNDGNAWTNDVCNTSTGTCSYTTTVCHGLYLTFTAAAVNDIDHCEGWNEQGTLNHNITVGTTVTGGDHDCAITCPSKSMAGLNVVPASVSGVWLPGATADVPRWTTPGCKRLPDHPATEPNQAGGTWDKRCDLY
ncbi:MAG: hypothetical protein G01um101413_278 [Parcubacteria group bacterium Gr01-1014_13]|nr:MAG: hypothetical protein G01um101413_278 [Parcubacteria group bacterium Gr01-1014_13]